jgi:hypothetical protein
LKKPITKVGLVEWLKVKALSSNPGTEKKKVLKFTSQGKAIYFFWQCWPWNSGNLTNARQALATSPVTTFKND